MELVRDHRLSATGMPHPVSIRVGAIAEYAEAASAFDKIQGYLVGLEGYALMLLAADGEGEGAIVEIGSFMGRSTCWLAAGSKKAGREHITAVDHFRGSPEHQPGGEHENHTLVREGSTLRVFEENLRSAGLRDYVEPVVASSEEAGRTWTKPIRLLFIDGDHSYEASKRDFDLWSPFVIERGYVGFHDVGWWPGVTRFYKELMESTREYEKAFEVVSLHAIQKVSHKRP
jgi:predicted O-methyltransferase YrrM